MNEENKKYILDEDYKSRQKEINPIMRNILVDWLIEVHCSLELQRETLFQAVSIIDLHLSKETITKKNYQLLGIVCFYIS